MRTGSSILGANLTASSGGDRQNCKYLSPRIRVSSSWGKQRHRPNVRLREHQHAGQYSKVVIERSAARPKPRCGSRRARHGSWWFPFSHRRSICERWRKRSKWRKTDQWQCLSSGWPPGDVPRGGQPGYPFERLPGNRPAHHAVVLRLQLYGAERSRAARSFVTAVDATAKTNTVIEWGSYMKAR